MKHRLMLRAVDVDSLADLSFLYSILSRRLAEPWSNISHRELPDYDVHCEFVRQKPYLAHYVVTDHRLLIGAAYLTKLHEIGIWIAPEYRREGVGAWVLHTLMRLHRGDVEDFVANINPQNEASKLFFARNGFRLAAATPEQLIYTRLAVDVPG